MADVFNSVLRLDGFNKSSIINISEISSKNQTFNATNGQWTTTQESFMSEEEISAFLQKMFSERNFDRRTESAILSLFVLLITFGVLGNSLVCYVVARNPRMRTPRNVFIINLAVSDLTLCLVTQPFNLIKVLTTDWRLGRTVCKLVSMFAGMNVFVSTASITAIALDRYRVIVYPTRQTTTTKRSGLVVPLGSVWLASVVLACPLLVLNDTAVFAPVADVPLYETCVEDPRMQEEKKAYSVASMLVQYIAPIVVVSAAHAQISRHLKYRMTVRKSSSSTGVASSSSNGTVSVFQQQKSLRDARRKRRTDVLLTMISVVYAASWLPLNVFNIMADFHWNTVVFQTYGGGLLVPLCHVLVLCSACTNPLLYGWLNENFRHEFFKALRCLNPLLKGGGRGGGGGGGGHGVNSQNSTTFDLASRRLSANAVVRQFPAVIS